MCLGIFYPTFLVSIIISLRLILIITITTTTIIIIRLDLIMAHQTINQLFNDIESRFKTTNIGNDRWYLVVIACLAASQHADAAASLYLHLVDLPAYSTSEARQGLVKRLREALIKTVPLVGVCKPIEAILAISKVEQPQDRDVSRATRQDWQADSANHERATGWFNKIYARNAHDTLGLFDAHKDFAWISMEITYGLFLSDRQVLDDVDTQMVVLPAIMSQNLPMETRWHIRGTRRIGVSKDDVQVVWDSVKLVAEFYTVDLDRVPSVDEVEEEV